MLGAVEWVSAGIDVEEGIVGISVEEGCVGMIGIPVSLILRAVSYIL